MRMIQHTQDATPRAMARDQIQRFIAKSGLSHGDQLPTYAEFCAKLGFSLLTVQRAMGDLAEKGVVYRLHGKGCYVGKTPSSSVKALSRVGLIHNASLSNLVEEPYLNQMFAGILSACADREIDLTIHSLRSDQVRISAQAFTSQIDALILIGLVNVSFVRKLLKTQLPLVLVDTRLEGIPVDTVIVDNTGAVLAELRSLIALGHRRIAYITSQTPDPLTGVSIESSDGVERREAYIAGMTEAGFREEIDILGEQDVPLETLMKSVVTLVRSKKAPTAILTSSATSAVDVYRALSAAGIHVPETVSLAGAAGVPADLIDCDLAIDYGRVDFRAMGMTAIETLERRCGANPPAEPQIMRIGIERARGRSMVAPEESVPISAVKSPAEKPKHGRLSKPGRTP